MEKLAQNLDVEPKEDHSLLRFADLLKNQNKFEEAISLYQRRIELDGDEEEIWFCKMMIGSCWEKLTNWEKALHHYLEAFQMRPQYPDPIQKIATHYRIAENNDLAYLFAVRGDFHFGLLYSLSQPWIRGRL
jgi:tetratricopeptide (TPR) repeat protein